MSEQLYTKNHGRLEKFLEANSDTFLMEETDNGPTEVLFIGSADGGAEDSKGKATDEDAGAPDGDIGELTRATDGGGGGGGWWWWWVAVALVGGG